MVSVAALPLADAFAGGYGRAFDGDERATLERLLAEGLDAARGAHPELELDPTDVARELGRLLERTSDPALSLADVRLTDLYLALGCVRGRADALAAFEEQVLGRLDAVIAGAGASAERVEEVKQRLREKLFVHRPDRPAKISAYHGRGSLRNWVKVVAVRETLLVLEKDMRHVDHDDDQLEASLEVERDPELAFVKQQYRGEFKLSFAEALASLTSRDRTALRLQHVDRLTLDQTAVALNVHRATIARWNTRIRTALLERTREALGRRLKVGHGELDSIIRLIQSNLDVSVRRLLNPELGP
jgi:RNA polymerase sigma-70 factor (ECF subfamily)